MKGLSNTRLVHVLGVKVTVPLNTRSLAVTGTKLLMVLAVVLIM